MKSTLGRLVESLGDAPVHRKEFEDLSGRVKYLEGKLGVVSGK